MLTGTLVTAAGFLPVGIARSTAGEYAGNIFWIVGLALVVSWIVAVFFTPYIGVKLLPNFTKHGAEHGGARHLRYAPLSRPAPRRRLVRALPLGGHRADARGFRLGHRRVHAGSAAVLPDVVAAGALHRDPHAGRHLHRRHRSCGKEGGSAHQGRRRPRVLHDLYRRRLAALLPGAQPRAAERELRAHRHDDQGRGGARAAEGAARRACRRERDPRGAPADRPAELRSAGRLPGAVPRARPGRRQRARRG